ncbi:MAG TPA: cytochrome c biogenesis protein CcsA [Bacillota bacterium]|nr:cytochrome c biogenesis protein CcsA [Bacillota bacterium]
MNIGSLSLYLAFIAALVAAFLAVWNPGRTLPGLRRIARAAATVHSLSLLFASAVLLRALMAGDFSFRYVYSHTDSALAWPYKLSAFWAGPQGSLLFWALGGGLALAILAWLRRSREGADFVSATMALSQSFLLWLLVVDSPFQLMLNVPLDGRGINALLLNPWMTIHPPVILLGYALLAIPMAYAVSALLEGDYAKGLYAALPWALLSWVLLGAGILIGGVWAYQVLGWGGYWAWDPVENSSLVPWLTAGALIHGLLIQKRRGNVLRANHFLAITTYLLVLVATFVTRSGLLADFSVHAFAESPITRSLLTYILSFSVLGFGLLSWHFPRMGTSDIANGEHLMTRANIFGTGMGLLGASSGLILLGTLAPIVTGLYGIPATVDASFYTTTNGPISLFLMGLIGLSMLLRRDKIERREAEEQMMWPSIGMAVALVAAFALGVRDFRHLLFLAVGVVALILNVVRMWDVLRQRGLRFVGGHVAHVGLILILVGFLFSSAYVKENFVLLSEGRPTEELGYTFLWEGYDQDGSQQVLVSRGDFSVIAEPLIHRGSGTEIREPGIRRHLFTDIYLSPTEIMSEFESQIIVGEGRFFVWSDISLQLLELTQSMGHETGTSATVEAAVLVRYLGDQQIIRPSMTVTGQTVEYLGAPIPHTTETLFLQAVQAEQHLAWFTIGQEPQQPIDVLVLELKLKPLVIIMVYGSVLLLLGTVLACVRRFA